MRRREGEKERKKGRKKERKKERKEERKKELMKGRKKEVGTVIMLLSDVLLLVIRTAH